MTEKQKAWEEFRKSFDALGKGLAEAKESLDKSIKLMERLTKKEKGV
jgi:hypothetical protein